MKADLVFVAQGNGNASLRVLRRRLGQFLLSENQDLAGFSQGNGSAQAGDTRAHHNEINQVWHFLHEGKMVTKASGNAKLAAGRKRAPPSVMISRSEQNQGKTR